jgi:hypothetical protein
LRSGTPGQCGGAQSSRRGQGSAAEGWFSRSTNGFALRAAEDELRRFISSSDLAITYFKVAKRFVDVM